MVIYLAVDPGPTTGLCLIEEHDRGQRFTIFPSNHRLDDVQPHKHLYRVLGLNAIDRIICERFQFRPGQKNADIRAANYQGVVELYAQMYGVPITLQNASLVGRSAFWSDDNVRVRMLGLYDSRAAPHGMDALRHFLYYISFTKNDRYFIRKLNKHAADGADS